MRYVIDGYNVTKGDPATRDMRLEVQRDALVQRLAVSASSLLGSGRVVVVFDGAEGAGNVERHGAVEVRYSRAESADEAIVRIVRESSEPVTLVTSDRDLASRARTAGAVEVRVEPRERLFAAAPPRRRPRHGGSTAGLPKGANRITRELKDLWLTGEEDQ